MRIVVETDGAYQVFRTVMEDFEAERSPAGIFRHFAPTSKRTNQPIIFEHGKSRIFTHVGDGILQDGARVWKSFQKQAWSA